MRIEFLGPGTEPLIRRKFFSLSTLITLMFCMSQTALAADPMLHVEMRVTEEGQAEPIEINLNIPFGLLRSMAPNVQEHIGEINLGEHESVDLQAIWQEIRNAGPNNYVDIKSEDADVVVSTTESHVNIDVTSAEEGNIKIRVPLALGDLLFANANLEEIDIEELIDSLSEMEGDLVTIEGDRVNGRVYID